MIRIVAINDDSLNEDESDEKVQVSKEAEETIAVNEYVRALKLRKDHRTEDALHLFKELLDTEVLSEISKGHKDKTLFSVKYNCYKNIGFIYDELGLKEEALEYLLIALNLDDTDVFTMNKLGHLALTEKQYDIAHHAFEKCLKQNPNYWPAGDGVLQILCERENFTEAYGWALLWYDKNSDYERGLDVILDIREKFNGMGLDFIENCWSLKFKDTWKKRDANKSVFTSSSFAGDIRPKLETPDLEKFKISHADDLNSWLKLGNIIVRMYEHFVNVNDVTAIAHVFTINDLLFTKRKDEINAYDEIIENMQADENGESQDDVETTDPKSDIEDLKQYDRENSNSNTDSGKFAMPSDVQSADASAEDSDANKESGSDAPSKPKQSRRRGSGLQFLEQWCFWDRNRKYSQRRRNQQNDRPEVDNSIKGVLRKILTKYYEDNFDNEFPFDAEKQKCISNIESESVRMNNVKLEKAPAITNQEFQLTTADNFRTLFEEIQNKHFSLLRLIFKWTQNISRYWEKSMPIDIQNLYLKIFVFYLNHYDVSNWHQLDATDFQAAFRMTLFYLELHLDRALQTAKRDVKNEVDQTWFTLYNHIIFHSGFFEQSDDQVDISKYQKRLCWLQYCLAKYENDLTRTVNCLYAIQQLLSVHNESYHLEFHNQKLNNRIDMKTTEKLIISLERTISLNDVPRLYEEKKFEELIDVLKENLINLAESKEIEISKIKTTTQIEVLLECFWSLDLFEECFIWSERCLAYTLDRFMEASKGSAKQIEWANNVTFVLTYIESLIINESYQIVSSLGRHYSRLIQNVINILSHQLDTPFDKNNNNLHPIDTKTPWIIMHFVLQREEDKTPKRKRKLSIDSNTTDGTLEEIEETIPNSIMVFFTAHENLGARGWCTKDNGKLLLYTLDVVVTCLRTPYLETFRDIIAEYLEQITYCLYGYPAKRARLKHIEEHDAQNIELTWERAIQLYDLFRPDELPEFNSFKNDSITSETEQLMQRIIVLIPSDIDPNIKIDSISKFIAGQDKDLPKGLDLLPYRVQNIFYLVADHYFKNRDFTKSVKYYIPDLANFPERFDSWAGLALSKASLLETKLNTCDEIGSKEFLRLAEECIQCFQQCLKLDDQIVLLWIEYGNYAYALHSYCSRNLKQFSDTLSMERFAFLEEKKEQCLQIAYDCFTTVDQEKNFQNSDIDLEKPRNCEDSHDEKWLYHYMLGKISEKRKEQPSIVLEHYVRSAVFLYESNATYPFRISFTNPQNLSLEALEIFYRITASIIKYVEQHAIIPRGIGKYFIKILKESASSPFALSQAKINENSINAFKRKLSLANEEAAKAKLMKLEESQSTTTPTPTDTSKIKSNEEMSINVSNSVVTTDNLQRTNYKILVENPKPSEQTVTEIPLLEQAPVDDKPTSPLRRGSQESTATNTTQTTTTTGSDSTSSSSSDSSSSDSSSSDTDDSSSEDGDKDENSPLKDSDIEQIYKMCIKNLEECVTRFPEHYKSMYRLVHIYLHAPDKIKNLEKCKQLLLGTYTTALGNQIQGLFADRKGTNLFNGIWRNPSTEIDRPGSFSSHLSKCVNILMEILRTNMDHGMLLELVFQLQKTPEIDKRYIKDSERKELLQQALAFCSQAFKDILKQKNSDKRNDTELLALLVEIYKAHKKCLKNIGQKETVFSSMLVDAYKVYIQGKIAQLPENISIMDLAVKLCQHEINSKNRLEKQVVKHRLDECNTSTGSLNSSKNISNLSNLSANTSFGLPLIPQTSKPATPTSTNTSINSTYIPGLSRPRGRPPGSKNTNPGNSAAAAAANAAATAALCAQSQSMSNSLANPMTGLFHGLDSNAISAAMALYSNPTLMASLTQFTDPDSLKTFIAEYYKWASMTGMSQLMTALPQPQSATVKPPTSIAKPQTTGPSSFPMSSASMSTMNVQPKLPQLDIQSLFSSSTTVTPGTMSFSGTKTTQSTVISVGSGELTITPSISQPSLKGNTFVQQKPGTSLLKNMQQPSRPVKHHKNKESKKQEPKLPTTNQSASLSFSDMPGISITSVNKPSNIPLDLPKSLSITPAQAGYNSKIGSSSTQPFVTLQPKKPSKQKKNKQEQWPKLVKHSPTAGTGLSLGSGGFDIPDFNQQLAIFTQYNEILKSAANQANKKSYMSQFEQFLSYPPTTSTTTTIHKSKTKQSKGLSGLPAGLTIGTTPTTITTNSSTKSSHSKKGSISVKQLHSMQTPHAQQHSKSDKAPTNLYPMGDMNTMTGSMLNPFSVLQQQPTVAHSSSSKTSVLPEMPIVTLASSTLANNQISPTKTLQQKLADRQKALNDANLQATATNSRPSSTSSTGSKSRKSDADVIVLD